MTILNVTAAHIARGRPVSYHFGPIAYALKDRLCAGVGVQVIATTVFLWKDGTRWWIDLPPRAVQFVARFNVRWQVDPIAFAIDLPAQLVKSRQSALRRRPPGIATLSHGRDRRSAARYRNAGKAA